MPSAVARDAYEVSPNPPGCTPQSRTAASGSIVSPSRQAARNATVKSSAGDMATPATGGDSPTPHNTGRPGSPTQPSTVGIPALLAPCRFADPHFGCTGRVNSAVISGLTDSSARDACRIDWLAAITSAGPVYRATIFSLPRSTSA